MISPHAHRTAPSSWPRRLSARLGLSLCLATLALLPRIAEAETKLVVSAPSRPLELVKTPDGLGATFVLRNQGDTAVDPKVSLVSSASDPRTPPGVVLRLDKGRLAPGQERRVEVRWPNGEGKAREATGLVAIETGAKAPEMLSFRGRRDTSIWTTVATQALPALIALPLLGALLIALLGRARADERLPRRIAMGIAGLDLALALLVLARFDRGIGRLDGNDGFQLVSRTTLVKPMGLELAFGVDGTSVGLLATLATAALVAAGLGERSVLRAPRIWGSALLVLGGALGVATSIDLALTVACWGLAFAGAASLLLATSRPARTFAGRRVAFLGLVSTALLAAVALLASSHVGRAYAVDGSALVQGFGHADLVRASFPGLAKTLLGLPFTAGLTTLLLAAILPVLGLFPLDGFVQDTLDDGQAPALLVALLPALGSFVLLRWGAAMLPEGLVWASTSLAWIAAVSALLGALAGVRERRLSSLLGSALGVTSAIALLGLASATPQGVLGATAIVTASPLVVVLVGGAAGLLAARTGSADITGVRGLGVEARLLAGALLLGTAASVALPGSLSGWGVVVALLGSTARAPTATIVGALALGVAGLTTLGAVTNALGGTLSPTLRDSSVLEPFGGHIPDLSRHERAVLLPLALLVLVLGLSPRPLLGAAERASLDLAAFLDPPGPAQIATAFPTTASADIVSPP